MIKRFKAPADADEVEILFTLDGERDAVIAVPVGWIRHMLLAKSDCLPRTPVTCTVRAIEKPRALRS